MGVDLLEAVWEFLEEHHRLDWKPEELDDTNIILFRNDQDVTCVIWFEAIPYTTVVEGHICVAPEYRNGQWASRAQLRGYLQLTRMITPQPTGVICEVWTDGIASILRFFGFTFCKGFPLAYLKIEEPHG